PRSRGHCDRPASRKDDQRQKLTAREVDVYDRARLAQILTGQDAVISAFNPGWKNPNLYDDQVRGTASIIAAIKRAGVKRVLWVGGAGGLETTPGERLADSQGFPASIRPGSLATIDALEQ